MPILLAHGFTLPLLLKIVRAGLATASSDRMRAGKRMLDVTKVRITDVGRAALARARRE
jgi:hypothetical protein